MKKLFLSGSEINERWGVPPAQILSGIRAGKLIPYDLSGSKRIYDRTCPTPLFERNPTFTKLNYSNVLDCIYKADDVKAFLADLDLYDPELVVIIEN
jgi:hypothetical protein